MRIVFRIELYLGKSSQTTKTVDMNKYNFKQTENNENKLLHEVLYKKNSRLLLLRCFLALFLSRFIALTFYQFISGIYMEYCLYWCIAISYMISSFL